MSDVHDCCKHRAMSREPVVHVLLTNASGETRSCGVHGVDRRGVWFDLPFDEYASSKLVINAEKYVRSFGFDV